MNEYGDNSRVKILVTGAAGFVGSHLVRALRAHGYQLLCCGRNAERLRAVCPDCTVIPADFSRNQQMEQWLPHLQGVAVVINAAGIFQERGLNTFAAVHRDGPIALFQAAEQAGVQRIVQISALGADEYATTHYHLTKRAADEALATLATKWVILQPSIIYGDGAKSPAFLSALATLPITPLVGEGNQLLQPVSIDDVTTAVLHLVRPTATAGVTLAAVGSNALTLRSMLEALRQWLGLRPTAALQIPLWLVRLVARIGQIFRWQFVHPAAVSMLCRGNVADPTPFGRVLGTTPRSFTESFQTRPCRTADRWHASLYFLRPVLRLSIACVWIIAGVISLWVYPREASESLLVQVGFSQELAPDLLSFLAVGDIGLGLGTLLKWHLPATVAIQLCLITGYSLVIAITLSEFMVHPFGPVVKNLPLFVATLVMLALEGER